MLFSRNATQIGRRIPGTISQCGGVSSGAHFTFIGAHFVAGAGLAIFPFSRAFADVVDALMR